VLELRRKNAAGGRSFRLVFLLALLVVESSSAQPLSSKYAIVNIAGEADRDFQRRLGDLTDAIVEELQFPEKPPFPLKISLATDAEDFTTSAGATGYMIGVVNEDGAILLQPAMILKKHKNIRAALKHEIAHLFIRQNAGRGCPLWLQEALAIRISGWPKSGLASERRNWSPTELEKLSGNLRLGRDKKTLGEAYGQAAAVGKILSENFGLPTLIAALPALRENGDVFRWRIGQKRVIDAILSRTSGEEKK
jgi:hypothetical protein